MTPRLHRPVSNRGAWRDSYVVATDGVPDPSLTTFTLVAWPADAQAQTWDYGQPTAGARGLVLSASSADETGRLAAQVNGTALVLTWQFPAAQMRGLEPGVYEAGINAWIAGETTEIAAFQFVVQARGGIGPSGAAPLPPEFPGEPLDVTVTVGSGEVG